MDFVAIDFETANFKRQSVCSIGLAIVKNSRIVDTYSRLIKPTPNYYESINMSIHHITPDMTEDAPTFDEVWTEIEPTLRNQQIVAHNAAFDFSALRYVLSEYNINFPSLAYYCSMLISKKLFSGLINYQLPTVCRYFNITDLKHHEAESDAVGCAKIMLQISKEKNVTSLSDLAEKEDFTAGNIYPNSYTPFHIKSRRVSYQSRIEIEPTTSDFDEEHPFFEKRVVFTGALSNLSRNDAKQIVANIGGIIKPENLSSKTNYLVVGTYDYNQYGEGYKSTKMKKAEELISQGKELEIISEDDFFKMVHSESTTFEITIDQIDEDSEILIKRNLYNELSGKKIYFTDDLSVNRLEAFQMVGYCSGYGHDYDNEEIPNSDYFIISDKHLTQLSQGVKSKAILDFEKVRNSSQNRGDLKSVKLIKESTFLEYMERRTKFQNKEVKMNIYEWEINEELRQ